MLFLLNNNYNFNNKYICMIVEKLMMPYVLASQHTIVNLALGIIMAWSLELQDVTPCIDPNNCVTHEDIELNQSVKLAYSILMYAHFTSFALHFIITRISVA